MGNSFYSMLQHHFYLYKLVCRLLDAEVPNVVSTALWYNPFYVISLLYEKCILLVISTGCWGKHVIKLHISIHANKFKLVWNNFTLKFLSKLPFVWMLYVLIIADMINHIYDFTSVFWVLLLKIPLWIKIVPLCLQSNLT